MEAAGGEASEGMAKRAGGVLACGQESGGRGIMSVKAALLAGGKQHRLDMQAEGVSGQGAKAAATSSLAPAGLCAP